MKRCDQNNVQNFLDFLQNAPADDDIIRMDCDDFCDEISQMAERVANGEDLTHILPALENHITHWSGCREEFEALVAVLKAERDSAANSE